VSSVRCVRGERLRDREPSSGGVSRSRSAGSNIGQEGVFARPLLQGLAATEAVVTAGLVVAVSPC
jgi:hypothetical protein